MSIHAEHLTWLREVIGKSRESRPLKLKRERALEFDQRTTPRTDAIGDVVGGFYQ